MSWTESNRFRMFGENWTFSWPWNNQNKRQQRGSKLGAFEPTDESACDMSHDCRRNWDRGFPTITITIAEWRKPFNTFTSARTIQEPGGCPSSFAWALPISVLGWNQSSIWRASSSSSNFVLIWVRTSAGTSRRRNCSFADASCYDMIWRETVLDYVGQRKIILNVERINLAYKRLNGVFGW